MASVWVYKTTDKDFIGSSGLKSMAYGSTYRKDIVAGGISDFIGRGKSNHPRSVKLNLT